MIEVSEPLPAAISRSSQAPSVGVVRQGLAAVGDDVLHGVKPGVVVVAQARAARRRPWSRASAAGPTPTRSCRPAPGPRPRRSAPRHAPARRTARPPPRRHRPAPERRRAPAPPSPTHRASAGWRRRSPWCRRASSPSAMQADRIGADLVEQLRPGPASARCPDPCAASPAGCRSCAHCGSAISERCPPRREHGSPRLPPKWPRNRDARRKFPSPAAPAAGLATIRIDRRGPVKCTGVSLW